MQASILIKTESPLNSWDYFDKIFCITLTERPDRKKNAKIEFDKVGLTHKVEFLTVNRHPSNCEKGIYESHLACIKKGIEAGAEHIVVFEDDILFDRFSAETLKNCIDFLTQDPGWKALFFGCLVSGSKKTRNKNIRAVKYRSLTHAYVLRRGFAEVLVRQPWQEIAYDDFMKSFNDGFYAAYPAFAFQSESPSDNSKYLWLDKIRRLCGGLRRIQKGNEFIFRYKMGLIAVHMMLALLAAIWIF